MRRSVENRKVKIKGTKDYKIVSSIVPNVPALKQRKRRRHSKKRHAGKKSDSKGDKKIPIKGRHKKKKTSSVKKYKSVKPDYMYT